MIKIEIDKKEQKITISGDKSEMNPYVSSILNGNNIEAKIQSTPVEIKKPKHVYSDGKIPTRELLEFIIQKPNFEHDTNEIMEIFCGDVFKAHSNKKLEYNRVYTTLRRVHQRILKEYVGKWKSDWLVHKDDSKYKHYWFEQN